MVMAVLPSKSSTKGHGQQLQWEDGNSNLSQTSHRTALGRGKWNNFKIDHRPADERFLRAFWQLAEWNVTTSAFSRWMDCCF
jgi:hypothetical protein